MATTNYSWNLPTVGGSEDTWGTDLNANWTSLDTLLGGTNATEFAILDGATVTTAELNILDGVTATAAEINLLDGVTASTAELNILDGITATTTELNYVDGVTSAIQTQLDAKAPLASPALTGTPTAPTAAAGTDTTQIATTAFVADTAIGVGQTWQNVSGSRTGGNTSYQNTTGRPIMVSFAKNNSSQWTVDVSPDNSTWITIGGGASDERTHSSFIVPDTWYYRASFTGSADAWAELR